MKVKKKDNGNKCNLSVKINAKINIHIKHEDYLIR